MMLENLSVRIKTMAYYAIDFGTSNSLLNYISDDKTITPVPLVGDDGFILRSLIFTLDKKSWFFGEDAIEQYSENDGEGRFLRSLKKFLPEPNYSGTEIHNKKYLIEDMIAIFLREMRERADKFTGLKVTSVIVGRPAKYDLNPEYDQLAEDRMRKACELAGFSTIHFCPEPLAAGLDFDKDNIKEKTVLIADLGGGTSDFTLMKLHSGQYSQEDILGLSGVFIAGDALDGEMMYRFIAKHFGAEYEFQLPMSKEPLPFPRGLLRKICSPAHITHLREEETWNYLKKIHQFAVDGENKRKLDQLFSLVECQLGYSIFHQIENSKIRICQGKTDPHIFKYSYIDIDITEEIPLKKYHAKMDSVVDKMINSMMEVFEQSNLTPNDVQEVVLTGGTAQFTQIQNRLKDIFGEEKLIEHDIYQSVVGGLSQYAALL